MKRTYRNLEIHGRMPDIKDGDEIYRLSTTEHAIRSAVNEEYIVRVHPDEESAAAHYHELAILFWAYTTTIPGYSTRFSPPTTNLQEKINMEKTNNETKKEDDG